MKERSFLVGLTSSPILDVTLNLEYFYNDLLHLAYLSCEHTPYVSL